MRRALQIIVAFVIVTIALTWVWEEGGRQLYGRFLKTVVPPIYDAIGFGDARVGAMRQRYINWIPFVGLMLVTPGLAAKRRTTGLAAGIALLFVGHLALNLTQPSGTGGRLPIVSSMLSDALPFVLWILFAWPVVSSWFAAALEQPTAASTDEPGGSSDPPRPGTAHGDASPPDAPSHSPRKDP